MLDTKVNILEEYYIKVTNLVINIIIASICSGSMLFPLLKFVGFFEDMKWISIAAFNLFIAVPEIVSLKFLYKRLTINGHLNKKVFKKKKLCIIILIFVNYYGFTILIPTAEIWYVAFYFLIIFSFFLDLGLLIKTSVGLVISIAVVCIIRPENMPARYMISQEIFVRMFMTMLTVIGLLFLVHFAGNILVNVKMLEHKYKEDYYNKIESSQNKIREIRHNIINQMIVLKSEINYGCIQNAENIINEIISETKQSEYEIYTDNFVINSILNNKMQKAEIYDIKWNLNIQVPKDVIMNSSHIGIVIGNILDNAIEACSMCDDSIEKIISVSIYVQNKNIFIDVENPKDNNEIQFNTWKSDKENHGIGLNSVKKIADKYSGTLVTEDNGDNYHTQVIMWNI